MTTSTQFPAQCAVPAMSLLDTVVGPSQDGICTEDHGRKTRVRDKEILNEAGSTPRACWTMPC